MVSAYRLGILAEYYVYYWYLLRLYKPLAMRYKTYVGEIDLIFCDKDTVVFIEVKARSSTTLEVLRTKQLKRLQQTALHFMAHNAKFTQHNIRFDLAIVKPWFRLKIFENITQ